MPHCALKVAALFCSLRAVVCRRASAMPPAPAPSQPGGDIWTAGPILAAVNAVNLYQDSKTFVDQPLLEDASAARSAFESLPKLANGSVARDVLEEFVSEYFGEAGSDIHSYAPKDFSPNPTNFLPDVTNETIRAWALGVHRLWKELSRQENTSVAEEPARHSLLVLPFPAVVAGDRFREVYYWDSYFIVKGLLVSGMSHTAKNVVANLAHLLQKHGLVPNGARSYYLNRSQPPLLSQMIKTIFEATQDASILSEHFAALEMEYAYWTQAPVQVIVQSDGQKYKLARYHSTLQSPRPESYREDVATAAAVIPADRPALWRNLAAAAASGWDFSSRWFADGQNLSTCRAAMHVPADLNAFLYQMETNLADFAEKLGEPTAGMYQKAAANRKTAVNTLLWDHAKGHWHDIVIQQIDVEGNVISFEALNKTYASNWTPLWAGLAEPRSSMAVAACKSFERSGLIQAGGVVTSLYTSSQQWDAPNAWPPLQYFAIDGLDTYGDKAAKHLAAGLAQTWLQSNYLGYQQTGGKMVEKYDALSPGASGGGGEYSVQTGFGWTNGVMLYLLSHFGWAPDRSLVGSPTIRPLTTNAQSG